MAVQAAPLPPPHHPFGPFGFPAADFGALVEKSCYGDGGGTLLLLEGGVGGATDGSCGALDGCNNEAADFREATRELLSFIDSASSNIKLALDKPGKSKRKVNHRKYLQKQIKRCTGLLGGNAEAAPGTGPGSVPGPAVVAAAVPASKQLPPPAKRESKSLAALFDSWRSSPFQPGGAPTTLVATPDSAPVGPGHGASGLQDRAASASASAVVPPAPLACKKVPLRNRNLPRSFFTEPAAPNRAPNPAGLEGGAAAAPSVAEELFELLTAPDYRALLKEAAEPPPPVFPGSALQAAAELPLEPPLYEPLPSLAPLLYAETPLRPLPALYAAVAAVSDPSAPFFADCPPLPPPPAMPYDYGYSRGAPYSSL
ncbi:protein FAM181B [Pseudonaja textilis]|uniref:Family with sequence similarity 181 member B n=1 Tax=Pseudonaja textilis TaxID=8673 RepID=A0A670Y6U6_PSETE|nr:protein FAM181B [Pseudonaja textilis]